jgi:CheY-like chemotaxis protein
VRLIVQMAMVDGQPPRIEFQVVDTGIGMTEEQCSRLFQRFTQVHGTLNEIYGGTGLGLAISKRLAEMLQGSIRVESQVGRGSTFTLAVDVGPLADVPLLDSLCDAVAIIRRPEAHAKPAAIQLDCRVLLAEDGPDNRRLIALFLRKANAAVTTAENGLVAVELAGAAMREGRPFDVILMDMQMPLMDGYEATRRLRVQGYRGRIVALTAHAMFDDRQKCLAAGCDDYVTKPVDRDGLLAAVLKQRQSQMAQEASRSV